MICVSIKEPSVDGAIKSMEGIEFAEVRLDAMDVTTDEVADMFSRPVRLIATCRPGRHSDDQRKELLIAAIEAGATFVDVELESDPVWRERIVEKARIHGCSVIVSHHDYRGTPSRTELESIVARCFDCGASIAKIACTINERRESARMLSLLDSDRDIIAIGMGTKGTLTRIVGPVLGSPFGYAGLERDRETAEGQLDRASMGRYMVALLDAKAL